MAESQFTWVKTHKDIVDWLKVRKDNQRDLIALLKDAGINVVDDRDSQGNKYPMEEMDPFTFFCHLYKSKTRLKYMQEIANRINSFPIPTDDDGIPSANALTARIFPERDKRTNEIDRLWNFFFAAIEDRLNDDLFAEMLSIPGIAGTKLSELLFYVKPDKYLCINGPTRPYIKDVLGISPEFETYAAYINILNGIKAKTSDPFYKISIDGWYYTDNLNNYWLFQCNPNIFDIVSALRELSVTKWRVSQHVKEIKKGDKVILWVTGANSGCYALGEVTSDVEYNVKDVDEQKFYKDDSYNTPYNRVEIKILHNLVDRPISKSQISVIKALTGLKAGLQGTNFKATKVQYEALEKLIIEGKIQDVYVADEVYNDNQVDILKKPINLILYGPPGTGKTYNTVNKSLEILGIDTSGKTRADIKKLFDDKMKEGQIVFTTFHQSMSYEDFVEGIKPLEPCEGDNFIEYKVEPGLFKLICFEACFYYSVIDNRIGVQNVDRKISNPNEVTIEPSFNIVYNEFVNRIKDGRFHFSENINPYINRKSGISYEYTNSKSSLPKYIFAELYNGERELSEVSTSRQSKFEEGYLELEKIKTELSRSVQSNETEQQIIYDNSKPFILIIDEINRGNVAQIFGELITLIEEDKRLGNPEALEVTLPYSKEKFGVPPNLYIIGTMNTADRSIEALDTALRRRFCFEEITPRYDLVELDKEVAGFRLRELLRKINDRIEKLIDKDHMIGHSYFMSVNDINDLKAVFQNKVNPLLQEYFFGDFGKIGLVLGAGFFEHEGKPDNESQVRFASFNDYDDEELSNRPVYRLKNVVQMDETKFTEAIATLMR